MSLLRDRGPQQGVAVPVRRPRSCASPATGSATTPRSCGSSTPRTASSSSTCARATSRCTSARAPSTSASPAATCCSTPAPRPRRCWRWGSAGARSGSPARRATYTDLSQLAGTRIATSYAGIVRTFLEERGIDATVTRLDGAVETSIQLGVADVIADVVETGSTLRQAGLETFGEAHPGVRGGADHPDRRGAGGVRGLQAPARGRPGGPQLRDDGLRHRGGAGQRRGGADARHRGPDHLPAASRGLGRGPGDGPARRRPAADGRAVRPRRAAGSCSPTSMPADSERVTHPHPSRCRTPGDRSGRGSPAPSSGGGAGRAARCPVGHLRRRDPRRDHALPARHRDRARAGDAGRAASRWSAPAWSPSPSD